MTNRFWIKYQEKQNTDQTNQRKCRSNNVDSPTLWCMKYLSSLFSFKVHIYKSLKHTDCGLWFCSCICTAIVSYIVVEMITNISRKIFCSQLELIMQCWNVSLCQVAGLYRDSSIGNAINIVVVRLILLERDEVKYNTFKNISAKCVHTHAHTHTHMYVRVCVYSCTYIVWNQH